MRHPIISLSTWTTVATVVTSALWLGLIEEQVELRANDRARSVGMRVMAQRVDSAEPAGRTVDAAAPVADGATRTRVVAWTR